MRLCLRRHLPPGNRQWTRSIVHAGALREIQVTRKRMPTMPACQPITAVRSTWLHPSRCVLHSALGRPLRPSGPFCPCQKATYCHHDFFIHKSHPSRKNTKKHKKTPKNTQGTPKEHSKNTRRTRKNTKEHLKTLKEQPLSGGPTAVLKLKNLQPACRVEAKRRRATCHIQSATKRRLCHPGAAQFRLGLATPNFDTPRLLWNRTRP